MKLLITVILATTLSLYAVPSFTTAPSMVKNGNEWQITFAVSESTDVEVSIVNVRDSGVVRHLAAGLLGANPPAPLTANSLSQSLAWDGKDDFGRVAGNPESLSVRVRAGMTPRLAGFGGEDVYMMQKTNWSNPPISIVLDDDGTVLIFAHTAESHFLRRYDASGNYLKTLYPPPADLPADSVSAYGINVFPEGGWAPKTTSSYAPTITNSFMNSGGAKMLPIGGPGEIVLVNGMDMQIMGKDGSFTSASTKQIITGPAAPALTLMGPKYFNASHNPEYLYLSGWYYGAVDMGCWLTFADTTSFWADGQVFRVDRETGVATSWLKLDSVPGTASVRQTKILGGANNTATIHGVTIDDSGHVFVCDRLHNTISVYDTNAVLLGSVPCVGPDNVAVSKRTGAIYVIRRTTSMMSLGRYAGWRNPGAITGVIPLLTSISEYTGAPTIVLTEDDNTTNAWIAVAGAGVRLYRDDGAGFTLLRDFAAANSVPMFDRVTVDRRTDKVYWSHTDNGLGVCNNYNYSISDWANPVAAVESTSTGGRLQIVDLTVAPNGLIYGYQTTYSDVPVERYNTASRHAPVPYANTGSNKSTCQLTSETRRGLAVGWQGQIAVTTYEGGFGHDDNAVYIFPDTGFEGVDSVFAGGTLTVSHLGGGGGCTQSSGVKFDPAGNLYVGTGVRPQLFPSVFAGDAKVTGYSGSIVKYAPGDTGTISGNTAIGATKVYPQPFGPFTDYWCTCRSPRFDVDPYGRLFIPNGAMAAIAVADNAGNTITSFGRYGNTDSRGGLPGPGQVLAAPAIPFAWPSTAAASEDYIYVTDVLNARLVRVRMEYALDNIPGLTDYASAAKKGDAWKNLAMTSLPNPFNPVSTIRVALPAAGNLSLSVYDMNGRLVRTLVKGWKTAGLHGFEWAGNDQAGKSVAAGLYVYRLTAGNRAMTVKTILAK